MQAVAKELFPFSRAIATKGLATHLLAAAGSRPFADWQRHTIDNKDFPLSADFCYQAQQTHQPPSQSVQTAVEARHTQPMHVAQAAHDTQGPFMMILEILSRNHAHCQYFRCCAADSHIILKSERFQHTINHHKRRYNIRVLHVASSLTGCLVNSHSNECCMNDLN